jgi:hypothetical protein
LQGSELRRAERVEATGDEAQRSANDMLRPSKYRCRAALIGTPLSTVSPTLPGSPTARRLAGEPTIARVPPSTRHGLQPRRRVAVSGDERAAFQLEFAAPARVVKSGARCAAEFNPIDVGSGSKADLKPPMIDVRSSPRSGHSSGRRSRQLCAKRRHACKGTDATASGACPPACRRQGRGRHNGRSLVPAPVGHRP